MLLYLELEKDKAEELGQVTEVTVPNITNMNVKEAEKKINTTYQNRVNLLLP